MKTDKLKTRVRQSTHMDFTVFCYSEQFKQGLFKLIGLIEIPHKS